MLRGLRGALSAARKQTMQEPFAWLRLWRRGFAVLTYLVSPVRPRPVRRKLVRLGFAVGDQGVNVLNGEAGISLIEPDWGPACRGREINEFLQVLLAR